MPSALAARGRRLRSVGCTRAPWAPVAGSSPSLRRPSRCHLHGVCLQNTVCHCAPFTPTVPRMSSAARGSSSQKCMRSSCVRSRGSAPPLRRGAAARQFPPSLCRCADYPLRGIPLTPGGLRAPQTPRGPKAPFVGPSGHYRSVMEAPPPNLRCSPAQGLGVVVSKAFSFHTPPPWAVPRGGCV